MALYALTVLVFTSTRSNSAVSALLVSFVLPQIALSPFAGVIVDRLDLRWALVVPNLVRTGLTAWLALSGTNIAMVLALNLGISLMSVALTPAEGSMIPRVVPKPQLETALSIFNLTLQGSFAIGFAFLGPLLVTIAGPSFVLGVVTAFYVAASIACIGLPSAPPIPPKTGEQRQSLREPLEELRDGFRVVRRESSISRPIVLLATATSVASVLGVLGPSLATTVGLDPEQLAVVIVPLGIGVVIGVLGLRRFGGSLPRRRVAEGGLLALGAVTAALAGAGWLDGGDARHRHRGRGPADRRGRGDDRGRGLCGHVGLGTDDSRRVDPGRGPRPRLRGACLDRQRGVARPLPRRRTARRPGLDRSGHRGRGDRRSSWSGSGRCGDPDARRIGAPFDAVTQAVSTRPTTRGGDGAEAPSPPMKAVWGLGLHGSGWWRIRQIRARRVMDSGRSPYPALSAGGPVGSGGVWGGCSVTRRTMF